MPYSSPKVSSRLRYHVSNSIVFLHRAGTLAKGHPLFKLFSRAEPVPFEKEINNNLVCSSCLKHANEMLLGDPQQADQRTQSFHFPSVNHQSLDPAARSSTRQQAQNAPRSRYHMHMMHDHSRFQRDIDDVTGVSLSLSLYYSQKSLTHNIGSASALPIIPKTIANNWK